MKIKINKNSPVEEVENDESIDSENIVDEESEEISDFSSQDEGGQNIAELEREIQELRDKWMRSLAELQNLQKRRAKERSDLIRYAGESISRDLLDIVDSLERALEVGEEASIEDYRQGVAMVLQQFIECLERHSIKAVKASLGDDFDPEIYDALAIQPTSEYEEGSIIQVLKKPYYFKDKVLRVGQVVVATSLEDQDADDNEEEVDVVDVDDDGESNCE